MTTERKILEEIMLRLTAIEEVLDKFTTDLGEFSERFEEVIERVEAERRVDRYGLND